MLSRKPVDDELIKHSKRKAIALTAVAFICCMCFYGFNEKKLKIEAQPVQSVELYFEQFEPQEPVQPEAEEKLLTVDESDFKIEKPIEEGKKEITPEPPKPEPIVSDEPPKPKDEVKPKEVIKPKEAVKKKPPVKKQPIQEKKEVRKVTKTAGSQETAQTTVKQAGEDVTAKKAQNQIVNLLVALVERKKRYPKVSRRSGQEGTTEILFKISPMGKVVSARVVKSCPFKPLNNASEEVGQKIVGTDLGISNAGISVVIPVRYQLQ